MNGFHIVISRTSFSVVGLIIISVVSITILSCDEVQRHKMLTFFFDGVPPLGSEDVSDVNSVDEGDQQVTQQNDTTWFIHKPSKECTNCHDMSKIPKWATPEFTKEPPQMCYDCHPESSYSGSTDYVHGPVVVGDCVFCHNPHRSKYEHLLKLPVPDICHSCHEKEDIESIADHSAELLSECLDCHVGHSSPAKGLLKKGWNVRPVESPGF